MAKELRYSGGHIKLLKLSLSQGYIKRVWEGTETLKGLTERIQGKEESSLFKKKYRFISRFKPLYILYLKFSDY
jgi:hypothetical protein